VNYYERIQQSLDHIERHLAEPIQLDRAAAQACFSLTHYYRMFHALVGHTVKDYIRKRRLTESARRLESGGDRIIDISFDYQFESQESFSRAFKKMFGVSPGQFRKTGGGSVGLKSLDLIKQYFEPPATRALADPRIKVLKGLPRMRVAWYRAVSRTPERDASEKLLGWADRQGLLASPTPYRLFGFDNPLPSPGNPVYGYELWITAGPEVKGSDGVRIKSFGGGMYAVMGTKVPEIEDAWKHFVSWLKISRYREGSHQCLEEHLSPAGTSEESMQIDLYLPLAHQ